MLGLKEDGSRQHHQLSARGLEKFHLVLGDKYWIVCPREWSYHIVSSQIWICHFRLLQTQSFVPKSRRKVFHHFLKLWSCLEHGFIKQGLKWWFWSGSFPDFSPLQSKSAATNDCLRRYFPQRELWKPWVARSTPTPPVATLVIQTACFVWQFQSKDSMSLLNSSIF